MTAIFVKEQREAINMLPIHDVDIPRCVSIDDYRWWRTGVFNGGSSFRAKPKSAEPPRAGFAGFCEDCTPAYQAEMAAAGLCDHPEILFYEDEDRHLYGTMMVHPVKKALTPLKL